MCKYCTKYLTIFNIWKKQSQLRLDQKEHFKHGCQGHRFFLNLLTFLCDKCNIFPEQLHKEFHKLVPKIASYSRPLQPFIYPSVRRIDFLTVQHQCIIQCH